jgi:hypothetical protein
MRRYRNQLLFEEWVCLKEGLVGGGGIFDNDIISNGAEEYVMTWLVFFLVMR